MGAADSPWALRRLTLTAMALLIGAQALIRIVPLSRWRGWLGLAGAASPADRIAARRLAVHVERAASRLPWGARCLPQAVSLSILLKKKNIPHHLIVAIRPAGQREAADALHAWVECAGTIVLGALDGPWHELARLP